MRQRRNTVASSEKVFKLQRLSETDLTERKKLSVDLATEKKKCAVKKLPEDTRL